MSERYDVVIVGAGLGGLACGAYLSKNGLRTLIVDKNPFLGGYCSVFKRGEFTFHAGPEGIIGLGEEGFLTYRLRELGVEKDVEFIRIDPLDRTYFCGMEIVTSTNLEEYVKSLQRNFTEEKNSIQKYFDTMTKIAGEVTKPEFKPPKGLLGMIKFAVRYPVTAKYGRLTFKDILDKFFEDQRLKFLLGFYPTSWLGLPPSTLMAPWAAVVVASAYTEGLFYPKGGMQELSGVIADRFKKSGGKLELSKAVSKILIEEDRAVGVKLEDGETLKSKYVVSNADAKQTFLRLVGEQHLGEDFAKYVRRMKQSVSGFVVYLGVDADLRRYSCQINYLGEDEKADWDEYYSTLWSGQLNLEGLGIRIPSNLEPSYAPAGKSSVILISLAPYNYKNNWNTGSKGARTKEYRSLKKDIANKMVNKAEKVIPELSQSIIVKDAATPLTFQRYAWTTEGAWYGPRIDQTMPEHVTPIKHLYLAGTNTRGPGVPNAIMSGVDTAKEILTLETQ
jgi:all-trans-retinol 13,14-reductase